MGPWDAAIIVIYLVVVTAIGLWLARGQDSDNFFVNRQSRSTALTLFSVVSTNVVAATLLGVASEGFKTGISWGLNVVFIVVFGFLFLGLYANRLKKLSDTFRILGHTSQRFAPDSARQAATNVSLESHYRVWSRVNSRPGRLVRI